MTSGKSLLKKIPVAGPALANLHQRLRPFDSSRYWKIRYQEGGNSGSGSYGRLAHFKAEVLNAFLAEHHVQTVIEFGCGDGNQLSLGRYPSYVGFDPAPAVLRRCRERFAQDASKAFRLLDSKFVPGTDRAELVLSLDVIFHLVEDSVFDAHMRAVFAAAERYVIIYSDDADMPSPDVHVRHRCFSRWIDAHCPEWRLIEHVPNQYPYRENDPNSSWADFWIYALA